MQIDVGESNTPFDVHLELLCTCSSYFDNKFSSRCDEAVAEPFLCFPDDDPQVFAQVILWMYRGDSSVEELQSKELDFLVRFWILAGKLEMKDLQKLVMGICEKRSEHMSQDTVKYIYSHTLPESQMRRLAVDIGVRSTTPDDFEKEKGEFSRPFLEDLCAELIKERVNAESPIPLRFSSDCHSTRLSPSTDRKGQELPLEEDIFETKPPEKSEIKRPATVAQMNSRKVKPVYSRGRIKSRMPASFSASGEAEVQEQQDKAKDSYKFNFHNPSLMMTDGKI